MSRKFSCSARTVCGVLFSAGVALAVLFGLTRCSGGGGNNGTASLCDVPIEAALTDQTRIGGAVTSATIIDEAGAEWTLYNVANELRASPVGTTAGPVYSVQVPGYIQDIEITTAPTLNGIRYALLAMGSEGIAVINLADPTNMQVVVNSVKVNYFQDGLIWTEGGGSIIGDDEPANEISSARAPITSLAVYDTDLGDDNNPLLLLIGDEGYGLHKTLLSNLLNAGGPVLDPSGDGTLLIDVDGDPLTADEVFTLQYAGENPWGGPHSLTLFNGKLFVAMGYLGMGIFDPDTLEQIGRYNLYTDAAVSEDWYIDMDVAAVVQPVFVDAFTGMPDYRQASFEILDVWKGTYDCDIGGTREFAYECTPWANFDRYGREYYKARKVDVATFNDATTKAYIAYGLGGLIAVDVTGYDTATPAAFLTANYLGYAPAVPANGPDTPTGTQAASLFPHLGSGMLKEAGVIDVKVKLNDTATAAEAYFSDHFAGLVVMGGAEDPAANWRQAGAPFNNNTQGVLGDHWPDYEFVTSYDMTGADEHETLPAWMSDNAGPDLLATGEVSGHGNALALMPAMNTSALGEIDVVLTAGAGGLNYLDINDLMTATPSADSFERTVHLATTDEVGADADGLPLQDISIGHTEGVDAYRQLLFVADGPHGMSAFEIADANCVPTDNVHLVANTLQDEYDVINTAGDTVYPTPHGFDVVLDTVMEKAMVLSQSLGLRRVGATEAMAGRGAAGSPLLLQPAYPDDIFEHNVEAGNVTTYIHRQDHAYDVAIKGNLAFVADGSNGLTVYDLNVVPDYLALTGDHVVSNLGAGTGNPLLGRATGVKLWTDTTSGTEYAFVAAGHAGIAVVDVTNVEDVTIPPEDRMELVKIFEPIKIEDGKVGHADGRSVRVEVVDDHAYFTYDSFGIVAYAIADLIEPLPAGVDPTDIWRKTPIDPITGKPTDYRPVAVYRFKLQDPTMGGLARLSDWSGGALGMTTVKIGDRVLFYVGYGAAGVIKINWSNPAAPKLLQHANTVGEALDVTVVNGRAYVADNMGGIALLK